MAENNITVLALIKAKNGMAEQLREELMALLAPTRNEAGCINYNLHQGADDKALFMFYENWTSKEALDKHIQTPHIKNLLAKADMLFAELLDVTIWKKLS